MQHETFTFFQQCQGNVTKLKHKKYVVNTVFFYNLRDEKDLHFLYQTPLCSARTTVIQMNTRNSLTAFGTIVRDTIIDSWSLISSCKPSPSAPAPKSVATQCILFIFLGIKVKGNVIVMKAWQDYVNLQLTAYFGDSSYSTTINPYLRPILMSF